MSNIKKLYRNRVGLEDLTLGTETETQTRNGQAVTITQINAAGLPYDENNTLQDIYDNISTSEDNAAASASAAAGSASAANQSVIDAQAILTDVENIYDNFDDRYLGTKTEDPTVDNDGDPLQIGAIYHNSTDNTLRFWNGSSWDVPEESASQSALAAANSASEAANSFDSFDDRYLGAKSTPPTVDNDGETLLVGALYFNSVQNQMKVWSGSEWLDAYASLSGALIATQNLSDLDDNQTARDNLDVYAKAEVDNKDTTTLNSANSYTDTEIATVNNTIGNLSSTPIPVSSQLQGTYSLSNTTNVVATDVLASISNGYNSTSGVDNELVAITGQVDPINGWED